MKFNGPIVQIRMLTHQLTGHVVWYTMDLGAANPGAKYVPTCCPDLDYLTYVGPAPVPAEFKDAVKQYRLVYSISDSKFEQANLAPEFVDHLKLERAKCYALYLINNSCHWVMEKNGLVNNLWFDPLLDSDQVISIIATQQGISHVNAEKLYVFKKEEYNNEIRKLKYAQLTAELSIINAQTVDQVVEIFKTTSMLLGRSRASALGLIEIL